jgi:DNA-binding NtrC family response regulator
MSVLKEVEKTIILKKLQENRGNQRKTAQELGMPKSTLNDRLRHYHIDYKTYKLRPVNI